MKKMKKQILCIVLAIYMALFSGNSIIFAAEQTSINDNVETVELDSTDFTISSVEQVDNNIYIYIQPTDNLKGKPIKIENIYGVLNIDSGQENIDAYMFGYSLVKGYYLQLDCSTMDESSLVIHPYVAYGTVADGEEKECQEKACAKVVDDSSLEDTWSWFGLEAITVDVVSTDEEIKNASETSEKNMEEAAMVLQEKTVEKPIISVKNSDGKQQVYQIGVTTSEYTDLDIAVWSSVNGQDDLVWYKPVKSGNTYTVNIKIENHASTGMYYVHAYGVKEDESCFVAGTQFTVDAPTVGKTTTEATENGFYVKLSGVDSASGIQSVKAAVWCNNNQSDLVWMTAKKSGSVYSVEVDAVEHQILSGVYNVHFYATDGNSVSSYCGGIARKVEIEDNKLIIRNKDNQQKTYTVTLNSVKYSNVKVAVWSEVNGQDDLKWYSAKKRGGVYSVDFNIKDHKSTGTYHIHLYGSAEGKSYYINGTAIKVKAPTHGTFKSELTENGFKVTFDGVSSPAEIEKMEVAVWCNTDQSDLVWTTLKAKDGVYILNVDIKNHDMLTGEYIVHAYATDGNGIRSYCGGIRQKISASIGNMTISKGESTYDIWLPTEYAPTNKLAIGVWSSANGQDDLVWYDAEILKSGYKLSIPFSKLNENGVYNAHAYMKLQNGTKKYISGAAFSVDVNIQSSIKISSIDTASGNVKVVEQLGSADTSISQVRLGVWNGSCNGAVIWYDMTKTTDGKFVATVKLNKHECPFGVFYAHAYIKDSNNTYKFYNGTSFSVEPDNEVIYQEDDSSNGSVYVLGANLNGQSFDSVKMATWSYVDGDDDLKWETATYVSDGMYYVNISRKDFASSGEFITHVYGYINNKAYFIKEITYTLYDSGEFDDNAKAVMRNIIYAVETGGQVYGNARYNCFCPAYNLTEKETAITIGAAGWFATNAQDLLLRIREEDPETFAALDTRGISEDLDNEDWTKYGGDGKGNATILRGSNKAVCIQRLISSEAGIKIQDQLVDAQMEKYIKEAAALGVTDLKAQMFCANVRHLGGYSAMKRIINWCIVDELPLTMENIYTSMRNNTTDKSGNSVGANKYVTRHTKVMGWINQYIV